MFKKGEAMSKLIDSEELKAEITALFGGKILEGALLDFIDDLEPILLSCPKCHGVGKYKVPIYEDDCLLDCVETWENRRCELCNGTGKMSIEFYEMIQSHTREMQK